MAIKEFLWNLLPDFNTTYGFLFYSMLVYSMVLLTSWLAQPTLDESYQEEIKLAEARRKGKAMREKNKAL